MMLRRLRHDRRGGVGVAVAAAMPVLIGMSAFAVDVGAVQLDTRRLQGMADAAALAAAADPAHAQARAEAAVAASGWPRAVTTRVVTGSYAADAGIAADRRFTAGGGGTPDAVRIELESSSPTFLARIFGQRSVAISRTATARQEEFAAFSIGSRLASLDGGVLNAYLGALTGSNISLSVMDYRALAGADVDLFAYLPALRTSAGLDAVTFEQMLDSNVSASAALNALADMLLAGGRAQAAAAIRVFANAIGGRSLSLSTLIDAGPLARQSSDDTGVAKVDTLAFATAMLQLAGPSRQVSLDLGASVPGLTSTRVSLAIGERAQQSPWITISDSGTPIVRTAQARLYLRTQLAPVALPGIGSLATIDLPVFVELASAQGRLRTIDCASEATRGVTLEARTDIASAAIGTIDEARLSDFSTAITPASATLVDTPLIDVVGSSRLSLGAAEPWQMLRFSDVQIAAGSRQTVSGSTPVGGIVSSLASQATLGVRVIGLPIAADPLLRGVGTSLAGVAPALDTLIAVATGTLGVGLGQADLRVTGMRCGQAVLVA